VCRCRKGEQAHHDKREQARDEYEISTAFSVHFNSRSTGTPLRSASAISVGWRTSLSSQAVFAGGCAFGTAALGPSPLCFPSSTQLNLWLFRFRRSRETACPARSGTGLIGCSARLGFEVVPLRNTLNRLFRGHSSGIAAGVRRALPSGRRQILLRHRAPRGKSALCLLEAGGEPGAIGQPCSPAARNHDRQASWSRGRSDRPPTPAFGPSRFAGHPRRCGGSRRVRVPYVMRTL
jgi:hypothetical protein